MDDDDGGGTGPDLMDHPEDDHGGGLGLGPAPQQNGGDTAREQALSLVGRSVLREFGEEDNKTWHIGKVERATPPEDDDSDYRDDWFFHVVYEEADVEDPTLAELRLCILPRGANLTTDLSTRPR